MTKYYIEGWNVMKSAYKDVQKNNILLELQLKEITDDGVGERKEIFILFAKESIPEIKAIFDHCIGALEGRDIYRDTFAREKVEKEKKDRQTPYIR